MLPRATLFAQSFENLPAEIAQRLGLNPQDFPLTLILRKNLGFQFCAVSYNLKVVVSSPYQQLIREGNHGTTIHFGSDGAQHMFWPLGRSRILHAGA